MKATELMIGDWVYYSSVPVQVVQPPKMDDTDVLPVTLTPEILEKNGFRKGMREYTLIRFEKNELPISLNPLAGGGFEWVDSNGVVITEISYVHELQHALRLCGIKKEITL